jgi:phage shock protein A
MLNLFKRIWNLVTGRTSAKVLNAEWQHPEVVYERALASKRRVFRELLQAIAGYESAVASRQRQLQAILAKLGAAEDHLRAALRKQDRLNGPRFLQQRDQLQSSANTESARLEQDRRSLEKLRGKLAESKAALEQFEMDRHREIAEIKAIKARNQAVDATQALFGRDEDAALVALRERLDVEQRELRIVDELLGESDSDRNHELANYRDQFADLCGGAVHLLPAVNEVPVKSAKPGVPVPA